MLSLFETRKVNENLSHGSPSQHGLSPCVSRKTAGSGLVKTQVSLKLGLTYVFYVRDAQGQQEARTDLLLCRWEEQKKGEWGAEGMVKPKYKEMFL